MVIIDFEYSGNNDPMWDLGDLSVEAEFDSEQDRTFMTTYFGGEPPAFDLGPMVLYKAMCDLLWTLWGVVQHANDNPARLLGLCGESPGKMQTLNGARGIPTPCCRGAARTRY
jgi:thiamine kinase-like enzyme